MKIMAGEVENKRHYIDVCLVLRARYPDLACWCLKRPPFCLCLVDIALL